MFFFGACRWTFSLVTIYFGVCPLTLEFSCLSILVFVFTTHSMHGVLVSLEYWRAWTRG